MSGTPEGADALVRLGEFMRDVFTAVMRLDVRNLRKGIASWAGSWELNAFACAMERFLPEQEDVLHIAAELWYLCGIFFDDAYLFSGFNDYKMLLKREVPSERIPHYRARDHDEVQIRNMTAVVNALCERLQELGMTRDEVLEDLRAWMRKYGPSGLNPNFVIAVGSAQLFPSRDLERAKALSGRYKGALEWLFEGRGHYNPYIVARLRRLGMGRDTDADDHGPSFDEWLAIILGRGLIGRAHEIHTLLGKLFGVDGLELDVYAARAFGYAIFAGQYGIAAALALQFGEEACCDATLFEDEAEVAAHKNLIIECFQIAKTLQQPVWLDYRTTYTKPYDH